MRTFGRAVNDDYEAIPKLDNYELPPSSGLLDNVQYEAADYSLSTSNNNTMSSSILPVGEALPEDEKIYEDPGHIKERIYEWFKQRDICKLDKNSVR